MSRRLILIVPGLFGPLADVEGARALLPAMDGLSALLSRGRRLRPLPGEGERQLWTAFGLAGTPLAAVSRVGEAGGDRLRTDRRCWLRIDPVHIRADMAQARLFGPAALDPGEEEASGFIEALRAVYGDTGLEFSAPAPDRWYLATDDEIRLETHVTAEVVGRHVDPFLPQGADAPAWLRWLTEVQMLLHSAPANDTREVEGRMPVNSVWPWGAGRLPDAPAAPRFTAVHAEDPLAIGLARLANLPAGPLPEGPDDIADVEGMILLADYSVRDPLAHGDAEGWLTALQSLDDRWFGPLHAALRNGRFDAVELHTGAGGAIEIRNRDLRLRFWRRRMPWTDWLVAPESSGDE